LETDLNICGSIIIATEPTAQQGYLGPRLREGAFIGITAICLYLLLALVSYNANDPGWSATGSGDGISNMAGPAGAWLADVCFSLVGYAAYLFPVMLGYRALMIFLARHRQGQFNWNLFAVRALGLVLVMLSGTALFAMNDTGGSGLPQGAGGILGHSVGGAFADAFNHIGSRLLLVALFLFGVTIFTDLSWLKLMDDLGRLTLQAISRVHDTVLKTWDNLRDRRQRQRSLAQRQLVINEHGVLQ